MVNRDGWWRRDKDGLGVWPGRGKVAIAGWGQSQVDRRWDGVSMDKTLGAYAMIAAQQALDDAGISADEVDGLLTCDENMAGPTGGSSAQWAPRPFFAPPYDSEDGLTIVTNKWMIDNMHLPNVTYAPDYVPAIGEQVGMAAQSVFEGRCKVALVIYTANNLEGRYRMGGEMQSDYAQGAAQWFAPWGRVGLAYTATIALQQYCEKYGTTWDNLLGPMVLNERRNGLMNDWSFYTTHEPYLPTMEDYINCRHITYPLRIFDCDRPVNAVSAYVFTTAERARDARKKPVYVLSHVGGNAGGARSSNPTLDEVEEWAARSARIALEGAGLKNTEIDIFNPYDGYATFTPIYLEGLGWHGVGKGDAAAFFNDDISVEGPHPFTSGGGNLGNGRTRSAMYIDSIQQLRGEAGRRQVTIKAETAMAAFNPQGSMSYLVLGTDATLS